MAHVVLMQGDVDAARNPPATAELRDSDRQPAVLDQNVEAIKGWQRDILQNRSRTEQLGDWVARNAASGPVLLLHVVWFAGWMAVNRGMVPGIEPFDRFPFPFLMMMVSLEAIFLALFVLASQNRLSRQSDKRSHLNLQVDLLAEREMTAVLQLLQDIARHLQVATSVTPEQLKDLAKETDVENLTTRMDGLAEPAADGETDDTVRG